MKILRIASLWTVLLAAVLMLAPTRAQAAVSMDFFYDNLTPYGDWIDVGDYGTCWRPSGVDPDWTPYTDGYWAFTDAGWTWVSYEEFGPIVYHYGRWLRIEDAGWCWVPESHWAPAWVSWRYSDDYVGWAPLPPECAWRRDVGVGTWVDNEYDIGPGYYSFCRVRDFGAPVLRGVILNRQENIAIIRGTVNVTNITYHPGFAGGPVIFNGGPVFAVINHQSARPIPALKLVTNTNLDPASWREHRGAKGASAIAARTVGNQLIVAAPEISVDAKTAFPTHVKTVIAADKVSRGWGGVKDRGVQQELRQEIKRQAKGFTPASAPARPVAEAELKFVPGKADPQASPIGGAHDRSGKDRRSEGFVAEPTNVPPGKTSSAPVFKPGAPFVGATPGPGSSEGGFHERGRTKDAPPSGPVVGNPGFKPSNAEPEPQSPPVFKGQGAVGAGQPKGFVPQPDGGKAEDLRKRAKDAEREHDRAPFEAQHPPQGEPQPKFQPQHANQPPGSPQPTGTKHSKDSKDKDKDKDKNGN